MKIAAGHRVPWLYLSIQNAALKASWQNVAKHYHGFLIATGRKLVKTAVGLGDAHIFSLSSVEGVAQNPAAMPAVRIHASFAKVALQASGDARDDDFVSNAKLGDAHADLFDYTNPLVAENAAIGHGREISLQNVKIGTANRRHRDAHDGIARILDGRARLVLPCILTWTAIDQGFHGGAGARSCGARSLQFEFSGCHLGYPSFGCSSNGPIIVLSKSDHSRRPYPTAGHSGARLEKCSLLNRNAFPQCLNMPCWITLCFQALALHWQMSCIPVRLTSKGLSSRDGTVVLARVVRSRIQVADR
jgi:hypothetical protein